MTRSLCSLLSLCLAAAASAQADGNDDARTLAAAIGRFGSALAARAGEGGNLCQSPASVAFGLLMALPGARGDTAAELRKLLCPQGWGDARTLAAAQTLLAHLRGRKIELTVVHDLWPQAGHPLQADFLAATRRTFDAEPRPLDYIQDAAAARQAINAHVARATGNRITGLVGREVDRDTRLVLTDVICLGADWLVQFEGANTRDGVFHLADGHEVKVPLMHRDGPFATAAVDGVRVLRMRYVDQDFAFDVALPAEGTSTAAAAAVLASAEKWQASLEVQALSLTLPRFHVEDSFRLVDALRALGLAQATARGRADFSGIDGGAAQLYIAEVVHKTYLDAAERGTEAAAATAVAIGDTGGPPALSFTADRPFAFALRDLTTGLVLFAGRIADPRPQRG